MPAGELRRKDREITAEECERMLDRLLVCRVATASVDGAPYVVPMNFAYNRESREVLLHCATEGMLLENLAANPKVCLEVDEPGEVIATGEYACDTSHVYESVICFGEGRIVTDKMEKRHVLERLVQKYLDGLMPDRRYDPEMTTLDATIAIVVRVDSMTGKRRLAP